MESKTSNQDVIREAQKIIFRLSRFTASISPVQIDGIYGPETEAQIRNFQKYIGFRLPEFLIKQLLKVL